MHALQSQRRYDVHTFGLIAIVFGLLTLMTCGRALIMKERILSHLADERAYSGGDLGHEEMLHAAREAAVLGPYFDSAPVASVVVLCILSIFLLRQHPRIARYLFVGGFGALEIGYLIFDIDRLIHPIFFLLAVGWVLYRDRRWPSSAPAPRSNGPA